MASVKVHAYSGPHDGQGSCDFRGENYVGKNEGDRHRTLFEWEYGDGVDTNEHIEETLRDGPGMNRVMARLIKADGLPFELKLFLGMIGAGEKLRIGVWDE